jgi:hypothetical protein
MLLYLDYAIIPRLCYYTQIDRLIYNGPVVITTTKLFEPSI